MQLEELRDFDNIFFCLTGKGKDIGEDEEEIAVYSANRRNR